MEIVYVLGGWARWLSLMYRRVFLRPLMSDRTSTKSYLVYLDSD
jgi:hypothetical protein